MQASQSGGPGTGDWRDNIVDDDRRIGEVLATTERIAVLGIKPEDRAHKPAHYVPKYLHDAGFEIVPVPVYYPDCTQILGLKCYRSVEAVPVPLDMVLVFRRSEHVPPHVDDIIAKRPRVAWFQSGIRNEEAAARLAQAGILVVQDRCVMVEHRRRR